MANIYFKTVTLKNFMSYEYAELQLDQNGFIVVKGINNNPNDSAKSNGSGKSSLFSAITWCLTGETISGAKNVENIYLKGTTEVTVNFDLDGINYSITRTKGPSNLYFYVNGEDKSGKGIRDTEKIVTEYLPQITYKLITSVIVLGQGLPQRFSNNTPAGRKEVLEQLSNSDFMIADIKERLTKRKDDINAQREKLKTERTECSVLKSVTDTEIFTLTKSLEELNIDVFQEELKKTQELLNEDITDEELLAAMLKETTDSKSEIEVGYDYFISSFEQKKNELPLASLDTLNEDFYNLKVTQVQLSQELKNKKSIKDVCPTCGQKIPGVFMPDTSELEASLQQVEKEMQQISDDLERLKADNDAIIKEFENNFNKTKGELKAQKDMLADDYANLFMKHSNLTSEITTYKSKIEMLNQQIESVDNKRNEITSKLIQDTNKVNELDNKILYIDNELSIIDKRAEIHSQMETLIKRDFRGYLLSNVIEYISNRTKVYCKEIFDTTDITFALEGNNIVILYDNKEYEVLSGGEKQKIDIIVQLALRDMLCKYLNFSSNILVLDEITDALDSTGAMKVFDLISKKLSDVKAIYIISHHIDDFDIPQDSEIIIEKGSDKISRII